MSLNLDNVNSGGAKKDYGRIDEGTFPARVVQIIDMGYQQQLDWQTQEPLMYEDSGNPIIKPEVYINFEFPTETIEIDGEERPRWLGKTYTLSTHEKAALTALRKATATNSNNVADMLGAACSVSVGSTNKGNPKIISVSSVMKGMQVDDLANAPSVFDFDSPDMDVWNKLPQWMQDKIKGAQNFAGSALDRALGSAPTVDPNADIDFDPN